MDEKYSQKLIEKSINELYESKEITNEVLKTLYTLIGDTLLESLHIFESRSVTKVQSKSGRIMYRVSDLCLYPKEELDPYERDVFTCLLKPRHCSCKEFFRKVVAGESMMLCRHIFALILSDIFNEFYVEIIEDVPFGERIYNWKRTDWTQNNEI